MLNVLPGVAPEFIALPHPHGVTLRRSRASDAEAVALAVAQSHAHLLPWMPWAADPASMDPGFQAERLAAGEAAWLRGEQFEYVLVSNADSVARPGGVLGVCSLMTRRGPGTLEIGYWTHAAVGGRGYGRAIGRALTDLARRFTGVDEIFIVCDAANERSAAIPRALGYRLRETNTRPITAPGECGQELVWVTTGGG